MEIIIIIFHGIERKKKYTYDLEYFFIPILIIFSSKNKVLKEIGLSSNNQWKGNHQGFFFLKHTTNITR